MPFLQTLASLDLIHRNAQGYESSLRTRELYGEVFGTRVPAYIIFHAVFGYVTLAIGLLALFLRIPWKPISQWRWLHSYLGIGWIITTTWMALTAIWCIYLWSGWDIVAFSIFSMYGIVPSAIDLAWICIRIWKIGAAKEKVELAPLAPQGRRKRLLLCWKIAHAATHGLLGDHAARRRYFFPYAISKSLPL
ncbi:hypothetical protein LTR78_010335 [Recurvomyces mirabilis]|uniref:Uncharacterized protein n=1 Tax=Recurvomyces mirabilis TaxID=574656 RepID=A0AAE0TQ78_9PEZI|nr:hypothetical protein LTR78_010335 [Recurvomyces mirabilis]KAK5156224.1 hypothetical protein LTS14_005111 [Recurvomyces mirabilis]